MYSKKYVELLCDTETDKNLRIWCKEHNFNLGSDYFQKVKPVSRFQFHCTIFYSVISTEGELFIQKINPLIVDVADFEVLGENRKVPVLLLEKHHQLLRYRKHFEEMGLKDLYPAFLPHVSVSYEDRKYDQRVELPDFPIVFDTLRVTNVQKESS